MVVKAIYFVNLLSSETETRNFIHESQSIYKMHTVKTDL